MRQILSNKKMRRSALVGGMILLLFILNTYFGLPNKLLIVLETFLILGLGAMVLWAYANRRADGTEWWQDDNASGWRGY